MYKFDCMLDFKGVKNAIIYETKIYKHKITTKRFLLSFKNEKSPVYKFQLKILLKDYNDINMLAIEKHHLEKIFGTFAEIYGEKILPMVPAQFFFESVKIGILKKFVEDTKQIYNKMVKKGKPYKLAYENMNTQIADLKFMLSEKVAICNDLWNINKI